MQPSTAILTCLLARLCLPGLLEVAEALNDADFAPLHEGLFIKDPGLGAAVSWHKDGDTAIRLSVPYEIICRKAVGISLFGKPVV